MLWFHVSLQGPINKALGKPTNQFGMHLLHYSWYAVDGDLNQDLSYCTATLQGVNMWWMVDLEENTDITTVVLYNRNTDGKFVFSTGTKTGLIYFICFMNDN